MAQIALAWVLRNPAVSAPIVGATKPHHLPEAVAALELDLTDDEAAALEEPVPRSRPVLVLTGQPRSLVATTAHDRATKERNAAHTRQRPDETPMLNHVIRRAARRQLCSARSDQGAKRLGRARRSPVRRRSR